MARDQEAVATLLEQLERVDRGHMRQRALDLGCGTGTITQLLSQSYRRCDGADASETDVELARAAADGESRCTFQALAPGHPLPFEDETFDLVRCTTLLPRRSRAATVSEVLRVLRLMGAAVIELPAESETDRSELSARFSAPEGIVLPADIETELQVTATNTGWSTLSGFGIHDLAVTAEWRGQSGPATSVQLNATLLPGDSVPVGIPIRAPAHGGRHFLELRLVWQTAGAIARSSRPATVSVEVGGPQPAADIGQGAASGVDAVAQFTAEVEAAGGVVLDVRTREATGGATSPGYLIARR